MYIITVVTSGCHNIDFTSYLNMNPITISMKFGIKSAKLCYFFKLL